MPSFLLFNDKSEKCMPSFLLFNDKSEKCMPSFLLFNNKSEKCMPSFLPFNNKSEKCTSSFLLFDNKSEKCKRTYGFLRQKERDEPLQEHPLNLQSGVGVTPLPLLLPSCCGRHSAHLRPLRVSR